MATLLDTMAELARPRPAAEIEGKIRQLTALADLAGTDRANRDAVREARMRVQALQADLARAQTRADGQGARRRARNLAGTGA